MPPGHSWQPYYPEVYGLASLPGYTQHADLKVDVTAARTAHGGVHSERPPGSEREYPMGERGLRVLKSSFLLGFVGENAQSYSAPPGGKNTTIR